jgi:hypothetical protein
VKWLPGVVCVEIGAFVRTTIVVPAGRVAAMQSDPVASHMPNESHQRCFWFIPTPFNLLIDIFRLNVSALFTLRTRRAPVKFFCQRKTT